MAGIQAFVGSWREEEKAGFNEMADALGICYTFMISSLNY
jgi:hypothetical protein